MTEQEKNAIYTKYPWVKAYEELALALKKAYDDLKPAERDAGDYSPIVEKVKEAFRNAGIEFYFYDDVYFGDTAKKELDLDKVPVSDLSDEQKENIKRKINDLKNDLNVKNEIAGKTAKDVDPFSIFGFFNVANVKERLKLAQELMIKFGVDPDTATSFKFDDKTGAGIPVENYNHRIKNLDFYDKKKNKRLWELFCDILNWSPETADASANKKLAEEIRGIETYKQPDGIRGFTNSRLYLYWVQPSKFLSLDSRSTAYLKFMSFDGIDAEELKKNVKKYLELCTSIPTQEEAKRPFANFVEFSAAAYEFSDISGKAKNLLEANHNLVLTGAPGTGKTYSAKEVAKAISGDEWVEEEGKWENGRIASVQFHPGYDYSDFVIGMKPVLVSDDGKEVFKDDAGFLYITDNGKKDGKRTLFSGKTNVSFLWQDGIFKKFVDKARDEYDNAVSNNLDAPKFVFIIDEINRADISRVFGELFSLLEEEYRYPNGKGTDFILLPNGSRFSIPKNLYIIGTMNDIDRSVESMDFALRRRFAWLEVTAKQSESIIDAWAEEEDVDSAIVEKLKKAMGTLNDYIRGYTTNKKGEPKEKILEGADSLKLGTEYELGGAYFKKFGDGETKDVKESYERLWDNHLRIILSEYLRGNNERIMLLEKLHKVYIDECVSRGKNKTEDKAGTNTPGGN